MGSLQRRPRPPDSNHSIPVGDIVLANPPPYMLQPWLGAGIPLISAVLQQHGVQSRVVRFLDHPSDTPAGIATASRVTQWTFRTLEDRLQEARDLASKYSDFYQNMLAILLAGPEKVFGFSTWRHNSDVVLELTRQLKLARPDCMIILGGPECAESPSSLYCEWVDLIIGAEAEGLVVTAFRACEQGHPEEMAPWSGTWVNPRHKPRVSLTKKRAEIPPIPRIDYSNLIKLFIGDPGPQIPIVMNVGCPFRCGFCSNTTIYPEMEWSSARRLFEEMNLIVRQWNDMLNGEYGCSFGMCDATVNAQPAQFDELCRLIAAAGWKYSPDVHGCFLVDGRTTVDRVKLAADAGFRSIFFGLESASPTIRRAMKKPGTIDHVRRGIMNLREAAEGRVTAAAGVIVGWPTETEEHFHETVQFLEWMATLEMMSEVTVTPLLRIPGGMDPGAFDGAEGMGLAWRMKDAPAGAPEVRCRRWLGVFEHFQDVMRITSTLSRKFVIQQMMPNANLSMYEAWTVAHGDVLHFGDNAPVALRPGEAPVRLERDPVPPAPQLPPVQIQTRPAAVEAPPIDPKAVEYVAQLEKLLSPALAVGQELQGWVLRAISPASGEGEAAVLEFAQAGDARVMALQLAPRDEQTEAFQRTELFNVVYLDAHNGQRCRVDLKALERVTTLIWARETAAHSGDLVMATRPTAATAAALG